MFLQKGYDTLQRLVPNSHLLDPISSQKVSKAAILKRCKCPTIAESETINVRVRLATDYLQQINQEKEQLEQQLEAKRKETFCLRAVQK